MGASSSSPAPATVSPPAASAAAAPAVVRTMYTPDLDASGNPIDPRMRLQHSVTQRQIAESGPHRCASRADDFAFSLAYLNFSSTPSRFRLLRKCFRSEMGEEPRDPHVNVPPSRLPRWDPAHPQHDPAAPFDSFNKPLRIGQTKETLAQKEENDKKPWK